MTDRHNREIVVIEENDMEYSLMVLKDSRDAHYRIINITSGAIYSDIYDSYDQAMDSIYLNQSMDIYKIIDMYGVYI